jgi:hypothetical protein
MRDISRSVQLGRLALLALLAGLLYVTPSRADELPKCEVCKQTTTIRFGGGSSTTTSCYAPSGEDEGAGAGATGCSVHEDHCHWSGADCMFANN